MKPLLEGRKEPEKSIIKGSYKGTWIATAIILLAGSALALFFGIGGITQGWVSTPVSIMGILLALPGIWFGVRILMGKSDLINKK